MLLFSPTSRDINPVNQIERCLVSGLSGSVCSEDSLIMVVPPARAAFVPWKKSSTVVIPLYGIWKWVWTSMPPGITIFPLASMVFTPPGTIRLSPICLARQWNNWQLKKKSQEKHWFFKVTPKSCCFQARQIGVYTKLFLLTQTYLRRTMWCHLGVKSMDCWCLEYMWLIFLPNYFHCFFRLVFFLWCGIILGHVMRSVKYDY